MKPENELKRIADALERLAEVLEAERLLWKRTYGIVSASHDTVLTQEDLNAIEREWGA